MKRFILDLQGGFAITESIGKGRIIYNDGRAVDIDRDGSPKLFMEAESRGEDVSLSLKAAPVFKGRRDLRRFLK